MNTWLVLATIVVSGILGGLINAIRTEKNRDEYWKSLIKGIVAAFLVPVFLEIIKSDIGRELNTNLYDYLVFGGFCLVAAIFSDKFIDTIGDKILQKVKKVERQSEESNEKVNTVIEKEAEPETENQNGLESRILSFKEFTDETKINNIEKILRSLKNEKYKFRTLSGIVKETGLNKLTVRKLLAELADKGFVKPVNTGKRTVWTLV